MNKRQSISVAGLKHGNNPLPIASRVGNFIATSGIPGINRHTGDLPGTVEEQIPLMFDNLKAVIEAAGGSAETILKVTLFVKDTACREAINESWVKLFPSEDSRPARHVLQYDLSHGMQIQCEALALTLEN